MTRVDAHVRWPGKTCGAIGLALIFLVLFASKQKEKKLFNNVMFFHLLVQKKGLMFYHFPKKFFRLYFSLSEYLIFT